MASETGGRLPVRAFQWDLARQVERFDWLLAQLPRYADWGYQELYLHLEDAVEYPSLPGVARADAYSHRQMTRFVAEAGRWGLRVVPIVNLWGHTQYLLKMPGLRDLNELRAEDGSALPRGQICPLHPRTLEVAERLLRDTAPFCTSGVVHVGLDESYDLGKHPASRAEIADIGLAGHFARYVGRLHGLAEGFGLRLGLWADMLALLPAAIPQLPSGIVAYDWYYYPFARRPRIELRNFKEYDLAPALRARGVEYWGCAMDGAFRHEPIPIFGDRLGNILSWWRRCRAVGAGGMLVSSWEASRIAQELAVVVDAAAASLWLDSPTDDPKEMLERGFARAFGRRGAARSARAARACDEHPFSGNSRWAINARWDVCAGREPMAPYRRELNGFIGLSTAAALPPPLAASIAFRRYLAARDVFVREAAQGVFHMRQRARERSNVADAVRRSSAALLSSASAFAVDLRAGRAAARVMWRRTRNARVRGPNELIVEADAGRLQAWRTWLRRVRRDPQSVSTASPVCGAWQFRCRLRHFAPAQQQIVLEEKSAGGGWQVLHRQTLIEFRADAAARRANLRFDFNAPVSDPLRPLRLAIRGVGQASVEDIEVTDGVRTLRPVGRASRILGRPPPQTGFPELNWSRNRDVWVFRFARPKDRT